MQVTLNDGNIMAENQLISLSEDNNGNSNLDNSGGLFDSVMSRGSMSLSPPPSELMQSTHEGYDDGDFLNPTAPVAQMDTDEEDISSLGQGKEAVGSEVEDDTPPAVVEATRPMAPEPDQLHATNPEMIESFESDIQDIKMYDAAGNEVKIGRSGTKKVESDPEQHELHLDPVPVKKVTIVESTVRDPEAVDSLFRRISEEPGDSENKDYDLQESLVDDPDSDRDGAESPEAGEYTLQDAGDEFESRPITNPAAGVIESNDDVTDAIPYKSPYSVPFTATLNSDRNLDEENGGLIGEEPQEAPSGGEPLHDSTATERESMSTDDQKSAAFLSDDIGERIQDLPSKDEPQRMRVSRLDQLSVESYHAYCVS